MVESSNWDLQPQDMKATPGQPGMFAFWGQDPTSMMVDAIDR
jgi:hypothetical protein